MKYLNVLLLVIIFTLSSCEKLKDWNCTCIDDTDGSVISNTDTNLTKSNAENDCSNKDAQQGVTCTLVER